MSYCNLGDKPTLTYQFAEQSEKIIKFSFAPIEVTVKPIAGINTGNYSPIGYGVSAVVHPTYERKGYLVTDYYVQDRGISPDTFEYRFNFILYGKKCGTSEYVGLDFIVSDTIIVDTNVACPIPETSAMQIQVSYQNKIIFKDQSNTSVTFSVFCGDCPEGFCRCPIPEYPGYCCLDCNSTAASIRAITNQLMARKNGYL